MSYEKRILYKLFMSIVFLLLGIAAFIIGMYLKISAGQDNFSTGYLTGTGSGLIVAGIYMSVQKLILLNNKEKLKAHKIKNEDERNLALSFKASHYSLVITVMLLYISSFIFAFTNEVLLKTITSIICFLVFFKVILYYIMRKIE